MKTLSPSLQAHLDDGTTTLSWCWRISRSDGVALGFTFYPFLLMDVPPGNTKPNPYSANAATLCQPTFPWRGRIT